MMVQDQGTPGVQSDAARQVESSARQVAQEVKRTGDSLETEAAGLVDSVRDEAMRQAESGRERVAERLASFAETVRDSSGELRQREVWLADLVDKGARELSDLAAALQRRDLGSLVTGVENFARRQPALYAGAAVALGFTAARLAKSTAERSAESPAQRNDEPVRPSYGSTAQAHRYGLPEAPVVGGGFAPSAGDAAQPQGEPR